MKLLAITDRRVMGPDPLSRIVALMEAFGPRAIVQLREKDLDARTLYEWTSVLLDTIRKTRSELMINSRVDVARCFAPHVGVHLPENGLSVAEARSILPHGTKIGRSIHKAPERGDEDADLYTVAPVFRTPSKPNAVPLELDGLREVVRAIAGRREVYALGGIDRTTAEAVLPTGVDGVAAIRAAWNGELSAPW